MSEAFIYIVLICVVIALVAITHKRRAFHKNGSLDSFENLLNNSHRQDILFALPENHNDEIIDAIHKENPSFDNVELLKHAENTFYAYQKALTNGDLQSIRQYLQDDFFNTQQRTLADFAAHDFKLRFEIVKIHRIYLHLYERDATDENLKVFISADIHQYTQNKSSGEIVDGDEDDVLHVYYFLEFMRKVNIETSCTILKNTCPKCGASLEISESGDCIHCQTHLTSGYYGWVVSGLTRIFNFTDFDERGVIYYK